MAARVGILGRGRIGSYVEERVAETDGVEAAFVADGRGSVDPADLDLGDVDLVVEAADFRAVGAFGPPVLAATDLFVLSTAALADGDVGTALTDAAEDGGTALYVPHGAVLGTDGLGDGREALDAVRIETRKNPANLDFGFADGRDADDAEGATVLYEGPTRAVCGQFPRNVNSHATVALAALGFDRTESKLVADPAASTATHRITATGDGTRLVVERESAIEGVTGAYTLASVWGSIRRVLLGGTGLRAI